MSPGKGKHMNLHVHSYVSMVTMLLIELRCVWQVCYLWNGFVDMTSHTTCFGNRQDSIGGPLHAIGGGRQFRHVRSFVIAFFSSDTSPNCIWKWCFVGNFRKRILYFCKGMIFLGSNGELCEFSKYPWWAMILICFVLQLLLNMLVAKKHCACAHTLPAVFRIFGTRSGPHCKTISSLGWIWD